ncbi:uncharacterized membrane protein YoaK (UPF0700 family) [Streptomyces umbrinus]|uniref:DUF4231 domain-containing protein n=1 Tax=Streptomyces umbrinus TaxID=67370 RepID=UPI00167D2589|nr:DUF4231 domain-containing protein [Streptomyces umbrinus]MCR3727009.1 uncharacterized membrane protein YoaK (UPF0700 family) [Streptomyces umbrinus]GHH55274.1 membrane protein [Streptomyces umbrinus]
MTTQLVDAHFPDVYQSADRISQEAQKNYLRWTRGRLQLAVLAATSGIFAVSSRDGTWQEKAASSTALASFVAALLLEIHMLRDKPEDRWYHGRALAESVKTLTWRYMTAAAPFPSSLHPNEARGILYTRVQDLVAASTQYLPGLTVGTTQLTTQMEQIRQQEAEDRKDLYLSLRVRDQEEWYNRKAKFNDRNSRKWRFSLILFEISGAVASIAILLDLTGIDIGGAIAAAVAAAGAWLEVKQYDNLSSAYALTATELSFVRLAGENVSATDEDSWSKYVVSAEQAISREHTMWLARRVGMLAIRRTFE